MSRVDRDSRGRDDLASTDEVKVYTDEGDEEAENLSEDKIGLVNESEQVKEENLSFSEKNSHPSDVKASMQERPYPIPIISPYPYHTSILANSKITNHHGALASLYMYNNEHFTSPPPAHMGININSKSGLSRDSYSMHGSSRFAQFAWCTNGAAYPLPAFRPNYPNHPHPPHFNPAGHLGLQQSAPAFNLYNGTIADNKAINDAHKSVANKNRGSPYGNEIRQHSPPRIEEHKKRKKPHIKKPLNAFMLFMKEKRSEVIEECTLKESAAINQILGRKWHALDRAEQSKYYDMARKEKELHMQLYPGWSARDNYAIHSKKKKRRKDNPHELDNNNGIGAAQSYHDAAALHMPPHMASLGPMNLAVAPPAMNLSNPNTLIPPPMNLATTPTHQWKAGGSPAYHHPAVAAPGLCRTGGGVNMGGGGMMSPFQALSNIAPPPPLDHHHHLHQHHQQPHHHQHHHATSEETDCSGAKKCRARFGVDQQSQWCKPCRRKKKCIKFLEDGTLNLNMNPEDSGDSDDDCLSTMSSTPSILASPSVASFWSATPDFQTAPPHPPQPPQLQHSVASMTSKDHGIDMSAAAGGSATAMTSAPVAVTSAVLAT